MHNDPIYLLEPVFHFLDWMILQWGDYLYLAFFYASVPLMAWILSGGLRRKPCRQNSAATIRIIMVRPPGQPPRLPPIIGENPKRGQWPSDNDDGEDWFAA